MFKAAPTYSTTTSAACLCSPAACPSLACHRAHALPPSLLPLLPRSCQVDGIGNLTELNGRFAAELDSPVLMVRSWVLGWPEILGAGWGYLPLGDRADCRPGALAHRRVRFSCICFPPPDPLACLRSWT